jgi:hypothetical protein
MNSMLYGLIGSPFVLLDNIVIYAKSSIEYDAKRDFGIIKKIPIETATRKM